MNVIRYKEDNSREISLQSTSGKKDGIPQPVNYENIQDFKSSTQTPDQGMGIPRAYQDSQHCKRLIQEDHKFKHTAGNLDT